MPIRFRYDARANLVETEVTGPLRAADPVTLLEQVLTHPDYRPCPCAIVVCRDVELGAFSLDALKATFRFTSDVGPLLRGARVAVVSSQPTIAALVRTFQRLGKPSFRIAVHATRDQAERWLGAAVQSASA